MIEVALMLAMWTQLEDFVNLHAPYFQPTASATLSESTAYSLQLMTYGNEQILIAAGNDFAIRFFDAKSLSVTRQILNAHNASIIRLIQTADDEFCSGSLDGTVSIWNLSGKRLYTFRQNGGVKSRKQGVTALSKAGKGKYLLTGTTTGNLRAFIYHSRAVAWELDLNCSIVDIAENGESQVVVAAFRDQADERRGVVSVHNVADGRIIAEYNEKFHPVSISMLPRGETALVGDVNGRVHIIDIRRGKSLGVLHLFKDSMSLVGIVCNSKISVISYGRSVVVVSLPGMSVIARGKVCSSEIWGLALGQDGRTLYFSGGDGKIHRVLVGRK